MNAELIADMDAAMDDMGDFMHTTPPPFASIEHAAVLPAPSPFHWRGQPSIAAQIRPTRIDRSTAPKHYAYSLEGQEAGQKSADRRDAIRRGGI